jgi:hypothetical protein
MFLGSLGSVKTNRYISIFHCYVQGAKARRATAAGIKILGEMANMPKSQLTKKLTH